MLYWAGYAGVLSSANSSVRELVAALIHIRDTLTSDVDAGKLTPEESANAFYTAYQEEKARILAAQGAGMVNQGSRR